MRNLGLVANVTLYSEAEGFLLQGLPGLQSRFKDNLGNLVRPCLKVKKKRRVRDVAHWYECLSFGI